MKNTIRILSLIFAVMFLVTGISLTVFADAGVGDAGDGSGGEVIDGGDAGGGEAGGDGSGGDSGSGDSGYVDPGAGDSGSGDSGSGDSGYVDPGYDDSGYDTNYDAGYDSGYSDNSYYENNYDDDPIYYGNDEDYDTSNIDEPVGSVSDAAQQYSNSDLNDADLAANKWDDIVLDTSKANLDGTVDFSTITENNSTDDNGHWILYLGLALIGLAVLGILYFIIATVTQKKRQKAAVSKNAATHPISKSAPLSSGRSAKGGRHGHFAEEGYQGYTSRYKGKVSAKADTAELFIPDP